MVKGVVIVDKLAEILVTLPVGVKILHVDGHLLPYRVLVLAVEGKGDDLVPMHRHPSSGRCANLFPFFHDVTLAKRVAMNNTFRRSEGFDCKREGERSQDSCMQFNNDFVKTVKESKRT